MGRIDELEKLSSLVERGLLTLEEFNKEKQRLLSQTESPNGKQQPTQPPSTERQPVQSVVANRPSLLPNLDTFFAVLVIIAFFLPWVSVGGFFSYSGYQIPSAIEALINLTKGLDKLSRDMGGAGAKLPPEANGMVTFYKAYLYTIPALALFLCWQGFTRGRRGSLNVITGALPLILALVLGVQSGFEALGVLQIGAWATLLASIGLVVLGILKIEQPDLQRQDISYSLNKGGATTLGILLLLSTVGAANMPNYIGERRKDGYAARAKSDLRNLATSEEAYFVDAEAYVSCQNTSCNRLPGLTLSNGTIIEAKAISESRFVAKSYHSNAPERVFYWDSEKGGMQDGDSAQLELAYLNAEKEAAEISRKNAARIAAERERNKRSEPSSIDIDNDEPQEDLSALRNQMASLANSGKYEEALPLVKQLVAAGDASAKNVMAIMYQNGFAVPKDIEASEALYREVLSLGPVVKGNLGILLVNNYEKYSQKFSEGMKYLSEAADAGTPHAQKMLGDLFQNGELVEKDLPKAARYYDACAKQNNSDCQNALGNTYGMGLGVEKDLNRAIDLFTRSANQGNGWAAWNLASVYWKYLEPKNIKMAEKYFRQAVALESPEIDVNFAEFLISEFDTPEARQEALTLHKRAADKGNPKGMAAYAKAILDGNAAGDPSEAIGYLVKAANAGMSVSAYRLSVFYRDGTYVGKNIDLSMSYRAKAEQEQDVAWLMRMGDIASHGDHMPVDNCDAKYWYGMAAEKGLPEAKEALQQASKLCTK